MRPRPPQGTSNNGITGTWNVGANFNPAGQGGNTATITFTPNAGQCASTQTMNIVVNAATVPTFNPIGPLCENAAPVPLQGTSNNGITGTWNVGANFNPAGQGGNTAIITFTPGAGQCATTQTMNIVVNAATVPAFNNIGPLCENAGPVPLLGTSLNGITGTWNVGANFNPAGQGGNTVPITFTPNAGQCATTQTMNVVVLVPSTPSFNLIGPLCENDPPVLLPNVSLNGISGNWDTGPGFDPTGLGGTIATITFTPNAGQCASVATMNIAINASVVPSFSPIGPFCENAGPVPLPANSLNGISGTWNVGPVFNPSGLGGTTTNIVFTPNPGQCTAPATLPVSVNSAPINTVTLVACDAGLMDYFVNFQTDGNVVASTAGNVVDNGGGSFTIENIPEGTNINVAVTNTSSGCTSNFDITSPSCNCPPIAAPVGNNVESCEGDPIPALTATAGPGLAVNWYDAATGGSLLQANSNNYIPPGAGTYYAGAVDPNSNCTSTTRTAIQLTILPVDTSFVQEVTCNALLVGVDTTVFATATCDSVVITTTTLLPGDETFQNATSCDPGNVGFDTLFLVNQLGCDSLVITNTTLSAADTTFANASTCDPLLVGVDTTIFATATCDSVVITTTTLLPGNEIIINATSCDPGNVGLDTLFLVNQLGCDSLVITNTVLSPADTSFAAATTCDPLLVGVDTTVFTTTTCDSVVITTTTLLPPDVVFLNATSCNTASVGLDTLVLSNQLGCDSLVITETTLAPLPPTFAQATTCDPLLVGVDTILFSSAGCDSLVITTTTLLPGGVSFQNASSCDPAQVGLDTLVLTNPNGCDSLVITNTMLSAADTTFVPATTCDVSMVGVDITVFPTATCDSVVITTTTLLPASVTFLQATSCDLTAVGLDTLVLQNQAGCDSLIITTTTFQGIPPTFLQASTCDPLLAGVDTTIYSSAGCDSLVITTTALLPSDVVFQNATSCNPANVGMDTLVLSNTFGCDSLIITTTTLSAADTTFLMATTCDPGQAGMDTVVFSNPLCDSIVITTTALLPGNVVFLNETTCDPAAVGMDTLTLINQFGCDSLVITTSVLDVIPPTFLQATTCLPSEAGVDSVVYATATCDSLVITTTVLVASDTVTLEATTCVPAEVGTNSVLLVNQAGCDSLVITNTILSGGISQAEISAIDPSCLEPFGSISIGNVVGGTAPYQYSIDGGQLFSGSPDFGQLAAGSYAIVIEDANGCMFEASQLLTGDIEPQISLNPDQVELSLGESYQLVPMLTIPAASLAAATWSPASFLNCSDCLTTTATPLESTTYTISILDENGCQASASISIFINENVKVYVPNVFSPNGDGLNDFFTLQGNEKVIVGVDKLLIFDRWGDNVFENYNFQVNDFAKGWDGTRNGKDMQAGVYVYMAVITVANGKKVSLEGEVVLVK
ncbi:MAG: gliding motility-associated C-terminal domain-containing protein [Lewinellaceae bacterium]|nr:gliding motility-associated C-terminal domain-containing protein [Lewinellaceae bacterium]